MILNKLRVIKITSYELWFFVAKGSQLGELHEGMDVAEGADLVEGTNVD